MSPSDRGHVRRIPDRRVPEALKAFYVPEDVQAVARRRVAEITVGSDPQATDDDLRDRIWQILDMLGLFPRPDDPFRSSR